MEIFFTNHIRRAQQHGVVLLVFARNYPSPMTKEILKMAWKVEMVSPMETIQFSYPLKNKICAFYTDDSSNRITAGDVLDAEPGTTWVAKTTKDGSIMLRKDGELKFNNARWKMKEKKLASIIISVRDVSGWHADLMLSHSFIVLFLLFLDYPLHFPLDGYVVYNEEPSDPDWGGRKIDIALHKGDNSPRPFVSKQCRVGNYVTLTDTSCLYFGAMIPSYSLAHEIKYNYDAKRRFSYDYTDFSDNTFSLIPEAEFTDLFRINLLRHKSKGHVRITLTEEVTSRKLLFDIDGNQHRHNSTVSTTALP